MPRDGNREAQVRNHVNYYRGRGWQPLPSDLTRKKPLIRFAEFWDALAPDFFERTGYDVNVQVMTGRAWGLAVLDLDGAEAVARVAAWRLPRTWTVYHSVGGRNSRHLWFTIPPGLPEKRKTVLWQGEGKHSAVELLVDRCLIMAPPSVHPGTGNTYGFEVGPRQMIVPAPLPGWVWAAPGVEPEPSPAPPRPVARPHRRVRPGDSVPLPEVLEAVRDKRAVARDHWGLRFARDAAVSDGWVSVHDFGREDATPSARFHLETGGYWRPGSKVIPFCQLAVEMGHYPDWRECRDALAYAFNLRTLEHSR